MFSLISSLFSNTDDSNDGSFKSNIIKVLKNRNILYNEILSGISVNINNLYNIVIPNNIDKDNYIQIKKTLKNKYYDDVNCIYMYKYEESKLKFINRIKIIDNQNIKCDEKNERIEEKLILMIEEILEEIIKDYKKNKRVQGNDNHFESITKSDIMDFKYLQEQSKYNNLKKILEAEISESE
jgi:hypothetical protein